MMWANTAPLHYVNNIESLGADRPCCTVHEQQCDVVASNAVCELMVFGPPCTPFSQERATLQSVRLDAAA